MLDSENLLLSYVLTLMLGVWNVFNILFFIYFNFIDQIFFNVLLFRLMHDVLTSFAVVCRFHAVIKTLAAALTKNYCLSS